MFKNLFRKLNEADYIEGYYYDEVRDVTETQKVISKMTNKTKLPQKEKTCPDIKCFGVMLGISAILTVLIILAHHI